MSTTCSFCRESIPYNRSYYRDGEHRTVCNECFRRITDGTYNPQGSNSGNNTGKGNGGD